MEYQWFLSFGIFLISLGTVMALVLAAYQTGYSTAQRRQLDIREKMWTIAQLSDELHDLRGKILVEADKYTQKQDAPSSPTPRKSRYDRIVETRSEFEERLASDPDNPPSFYIYDDRDEYQRQRDELSHDPVLFAKLLKEVSSDGTIPDYMKEALEAIRAGKAIRLGGIPWSKVGREPLSSPNTSDTPTDPEEQPITTHGVHVPLAGKRIRQREATHKGGLRSSGQPGCIPPNERHG